MDVSKVNVVIDVIEHALHDTTKPWHGPFGWVENQTGVGRFRVLLGLVTVLSFYLILGYGATISSNAIGFVYPAYATIALIMETPPQQSSAAVINKWFTYWMTFTAVLIVEQHCAFILSLIPFYLLMKTVFLLWCFMPLNNNGANIINHKVIRPYLGGYYKSSQLWWTYVIIVW